LALTITMNRIVMSPFECGLRLGFRTASTG
jgi:hypothetical protein